MTVGDENRSKCPSKETLVKMLRFALLEIRATDDLSFARKVADIFHNLPAQLLIEWDGAVNLRAYKQITNKAERYGLINYILALQASAEKAGG